MTGDAVELFLDRDRPAAASTPAPESLASGLGEIEDVPPSVTIINGLPKMITKREEARSGWARAFSWFGNDDRRKVSDEQIEPWSGLCYIEVQPKQGPRRSGTAFLITPRWAVTAGHVLWDSRLKEEGKPDGIFVQPGRNGAAVTEITADYVLWPGYEGDGDFEDDVGLIRLKEPVGTGRYLFSLFAASQDILETTEGKGFNIAGYPDDKQFTLWRSVGFFTKVLPRAMAHQIDTCPGESGGPVIYKTASRRVVVGVHGYGAGGGTCRAAPTQTNYATRITPQIAGWIKDAVDTLS